MRRLLLILLGFLAFGATLPAAPAQAMPANAHHPMMPPGHCGDEGQAAIHICLGCAVDPVLPSSVEPLLPLVTPAPVARLVAIPRDHRPGFDPPPPRAA